MSIPITLCTYCDNQLENIDGWIPACKAYPEGQPDEFDHLSKEVPCNNGIGFEPADWAKKFEGQDF